MIRSLQNLRQFVSRIFPRQIFGASDIRAEHERLKKLGVKFTMEPTEVMEHVTIAVFSDTCGNLIQIQQTAQKEVVQREK